MTKFRKGDKVTITGTVRHDFDSADGNYIHVDLNGTLGPSTHIFYPALVAMKRAHFEPGDMVRWSDSKNDDICIGEVLAISDDYLWISAKSGLFWTMHVDMVERVESLPAPIGVTDNGDLVFQSATPLGDE